MTLPMKVLSQMRSRSEPISSVRPFDAMVLSDLALAVYWIPALVLHLVFWQRLNGGGLNVMALVGVDLLAIAAIALIPRVTLVSGPRTGFVLRFALVASMIFLAFGAIGYYIHVLHPVDREYWLVAIDRWLIGGTVGEVLEPYQPWWLTDVLQLCYASYYFLPLVLFGTLVIKGQYEYAGLTMAGVALAFMSSFLGYLAIPAQSPYVLARDLGAEQGLISYAGELNGSWLTTWLRGSIEVAELNMRDCFPSGHTYISLVVLGSTKRYLPRLFIPYLIIITGLIFGTLYLRYHYIIDVIVGAMMAAGVLWLIPRFHRVWPAWRPGGKCQNPCS